MGFPARAASTYEPLDAGDDVCGFRRGDDVAVVVPLRAGALAPDDFVDAGWRDLLPDFPLFLYERA